ncbi:MAG TPA: GNAT family N-acyltransferase [Prosthecobacter sp.]|nr:GNAT family N-acyltransferase [Prosthecobacter sp.]
MILDPGEHLPAAWQRGLYRAFSPFFEGPLGLRGLEEIYQEAARLQDARSEGRTCEAWFESVLEAMDASGDVDEAPEFEFPKSGPLVIVANHPFGILDPVVLAHYAARQRPDVKVMTNSLLGRFERLRPHIIPVNPFGGAEAARENLAGMKEAMRHLRGGGALVIFPAGEVSRWRPGRGIEDAAWSSHAAALVRRTGAAVLPVYFPGRNSALFHAAGLVHPRLRTGLLLREFCNKRGTRVEMRAGAVIPFAKLRKFEDDEALTKYLRVHTFILAGRRQANDGRSADTQADTPPADRFHHERHQQRIQAEVRHLRGHGACLASQGGFGVYAAHSHEIPETLQEIGRLREVAFRQVGEGTGQEVDLDRFDRYYEHLFLWDEEKGRVAGAYRLGRADMILREYGPRGLYTSTLFKFEKPFLASLGNAVEMGRSFVAREYQRNLSSLPLLWRGIAQWMVRNGGYTKLFGPVSISKDYDSLSRKMMVEFLQENCLHEDLASYVKPRNPFRYLRGRRMMREFISASLRDVDDCSALISSVETDGKGIPVLLKHYLRLSGTILSFNVDREFSSVIDGLILVDLTETEPRLLAKYMGEENCRAWLARHAPR